MSIISAHELGVNVPEIPNRKERRRRAKAAKIFRHPGAWQKVNEAANMQRDQAIHKAVDLANKKMNMEKKDATKD